MQTLVICNPSLSTLPVAADASASAADSGRTPRAEAPFATILRGHEGGLGVAAGVDETAALARPIVSDNLELRQQADGGTIATVLPGLATTGKILPAPGTKAADVLPGTDKPLASQAIVTTPLAVLHASLLLAARSDTRSTADETAASAGTDDMIDYTGTAGEAAFAATRQLAVTFSMPALANASASDPASRPLSVPPGRTVPSAMSAPMAQFMTKTDAMPASPETDIVEQAAATITTVQSAGSSALPTGVAPNNPTAVAAVTALPAGQMAVSIAATPLEHAGTAHADSVVLPVGVKSIVSDEVGDHANASRSAAFQAASPGDLTVSARTKPSQREGKHRSDGQGTGAQSNAPLVRLSSIEIPAQMPAASVVIEDRVTGAFPLAATAPALAAAPSDRAETVASVVDRLIAAREAGLGALASVAIGHRDFGDITVSFADKGNALEVSVTAADDDNQRALAAALHAAERLPLREPVASASQPAPASPQHQRDAEGDLPRDSGSQQARGDNVSDQRRPGRATPPDAEAEPTVAERDGIYV